jgi:sodium-dependent dicarboxylate transporter 2/3/5
MIMLLVIWLMITRIFFRAPAHLKVGRHIIHDEYSKLGPISFEEKMVLGTFLMTAVLWVFRKPITLGFLTVPGWSELLPYPALIDDGTVAMFMAFLLFLVPTRTPGADSPVIMSSDVVKRLPWNIVLLFGGGFALAKGFQETGLSDFVGARFSGLSQVSPLVVILMVCFTITFLTELTSNTTTTEMILPVLASVAVAMGVHPLMLMIPATIAASHAFMMPVATPPNAIVFGSQRLQIREMAKIGFFINIVGIIVITVVFYFFGTLIFGIEPHIFPAWAGGGG